MSNTVDEMANRGSKLCMQICVNNIIDDKDSKGQRITRKSRKHLLDDLICLGDIQWLTPIASNNFKEFQISEMIKSNNIPESLLGLNDMLWYYWPSRQPQWDAIGIAPDSPLILVEAKAHKKEVESSIKATSNKSIELITQSINELLGDNPL